MVVCYIQVIVVINICFKTLNPTKSISSTYCDLKTKYACKIFFKKMHLEIGIIKCPFLEHNSAYRYNIYMYNTKYNKPEIPKMIHFYLHIHISTTKLSSSARIDYFLVVFNS